MIKKNIKKIFAYIGIKISKKQDHKRMSLYSSLEIISKYYKPDLIIDVGAAYGDFYKETQNIFSHCISFLQVFQGQDLGPALRLPNTPLQ